MKTHDVQRKINGVWYNCQDVGCDDFDKAAVNRKRIARKENITNYLLIERAITKVQFGYGTPSYTDSEGVRRPIPISEIPTITKQDWKQFGGGNESESESKTFIIESPPLETPLTMKITPTNNRT